MEIIEYFSNDFFQCSGSIFLKDLSLTITIIEEVPSEIVSLDLIPFLYFSSSNILFSNIYTISSEGYFFFYSSNDKVDSLAYTNCLIQFLESSLGKFSF